MNEQYRFSQPAKEIVIFVFIDRRSDADQPDNTVIVNSDFHSDSRTKRKSRECNRLSRIVSQINTRALPRASSFAPSISLCTPVDAPTPLKLNRIVINPHPEDRRCTKNHLIVHRSAAKRMRMTDRSDAFRFILRLLQDRLKLTMRGRDSSVTFRVHLIFVVSRLPRSW